MMTGSGSPCGACKFLRRKCVRGCVFAPYFCHEQGATHFAAIHKVFGASNVSKLLAHLPVTDRCEAAVTISYEAQARLQDPIYGCVSHIFALQQQVVNLQAQLASLKEQAAHCIINSSTAAAAANPNDQKFNGGGRGGHSFSEDHVQSWLQSSQNQSSMPQFDVNFFSNVQNESYYADMNPNPSVKYENSGFLEENHSFGSFDSIEMESNERQWTFQDEADDLQSVAFRYIQHS
ncbi:lateral organ boundaries-domain 29 [Perilla frutescens var. hirtella]|nr:lateral organ boundaries-domain 29 [Perilla frutescens var. hirtella]